MSETLVPITIFLNTDEIEVIKEIVEHTDCKCPSYEEALTFGILNQIAGAK